MIILDTVASEFGAINIYANKLTGSVTYEQEGVCQSEADRDGISLAPYIHALFGLIVQSKARKALMIGGGGGTLATLLDKAGCQVTVVDINPASFDLAKQYFHLPDTVDCRIADGKSFLYSDTKLYDAIIVDAFHGHHVPEHFKSLSFYYLLSDRLTRRGAVFVNAYVENDLDQSAARMAEGIAQAFNEVRLLDAKGYSGRNAIVMAGRVARLSIPKLHIAPADGEDTVDSELASLQFQPWAQSDL